MKNHTLRMNNLKVSTIVSLELQQEEGEKRIKSPSRYLLSRKKNHNKQIRTIPNYKEKLLKQSKTSTKVKQVEKQAIPNYSRT